MTELVHQAFRLVNLPFTILLILVVAYWLLVAIGALGDSSHDSDLDVHTDAHLDTDVHLDHDVDVDAGVDVDHDLDLDHDADVSGLHHHAASHGGAEGDGGDWWVAPLKFLNVGEVPAMVVLSILVLSIWSFGIIANAYWAGDSRLLMAAFFGVNLVVSMFVTRYVTMPLRPLFRLLSKQHDQPVKILGKHCRVTSLEATPTFGQAEISTDGSPILIHVRTMNDAVLRKGDLAVVVREDADKRIFFITANPIPTNS